MTRTVLTLMLGVTALLAVPATAPADVLLIEEVRQSERMQLPVNGMNKDDVRAKYGAPAQTHAAVGDPPITRWDYEHWSVYFEYDLVLFTVLKKGQVIETKTD
jgi:hypothetical protein